YVSQFDILPLQFTPSLEPPLPPRGVHQYSPHRLGCGGKKVPSVVPVLRILRTHQPQIGLMDQSSRLQCLPGLLLGNPGGGELAKLVVNQRQQLLRRGGIARVDLQQDTRNVVHISSPPPRASDDLWGRL